MRSPRTPARLPAGDTASAPTSDLLSRSWAQRHHPLNGIRLAMSRTLPPWMIAGVLLAMLIGCVHALVGYVLELRSFGTLAPRNVDPLDFEA